MFPQFSSTYCIDLHHILCNDRVLFADSTIGSKYSILECNQRSAVIMGLGQLAWGNEKLRCLIHRVDIKKQRRKRKPDDLDGTLESPGWRVSWRSIASVSGQTPWCGDGCRWSKAAAAGRLPCHPPGWNHQCSYTLTVTRCFNTPTLPVSLSPTLSVSSSVCSSLW